MYIMWGVLHWKSNDDDVRRIIALNMNEAIKVGAAADTKTYTITHTHTHIYEIICTNIYTKLVGDEQSKVHERRDF